MDIRSKLSSNDLVEISNLDSVNLMVSNSLVNDSEYLIEVVKKAQSNIINFALENNLNNIVRKTFIDKVQIYDSHEKFVKDIIETFNLDENTMLPQTFSATIKDRILYSISPELYNKTYPIEGFDNNGFERLLTHELAHSMHIHMLNGDEDKMGPVWFFEGFAIYVAKQFPNFTCSESVIWEIIDNQKEVSYQYYSCIFKYLLQYITLQELIEYSSEIDFVNWLKIKNNT